MKKMTVIFSIIALLLISFTGFYQINIVTASGSIIYVDDEYDGSTPGWQTDHFNNIQDGIDAASENGTNGSGSMIIDGSGGINVVYATANNVTIQGFTIKNGTYGIKIIDSSNNTIIENTIRQVDYGTYLENSFNNTIYHNNFINNTQNAYDEYTNQWDDGSKGNYWDDYAGIDDNGDGIGDTPYLISGGDNQDGYPQMEPITEIPEANFIYSPLIPTTQKLIRFNDTSKDSDGYITSWFWDFGDDDTSNAQNPSHQYSDDGVYIVTLNVIDDHGVANQKSQSISVLNVEPMADFTYSPVMPTDLQNITFTDVSEDLDGYIVSWSWDFGDGNTSNVQNAAHDYKDDGLYIIILTITDDDGAKASISKEISVANVGPTAKFGYMPDNPTTNDTIQYTDNSVDRDGAIVSWIWDLGDGGKSTESSPNHKYSEGRTYTVSLTVIDDDGESDTKTRSIIISDLSTPSEDYGGFIVIFIIFITMFAIMIGIVLWLTKKEKQK